MGNLTEKLLEELNTETVFTIPVLGGIPVDEGVVVSWIVIALITVLCIVFTRGLKVENPSRRQLAIEVGFTKLQGMFDNMLGEHGKQYTPIMATLLLFIGLSNIFLIFGFKPPTKDLNVTVGSGRGGHRPHRGGRVPAQGSEKVPEELFRACGHRHPHQHPGAGHPAPVPCVCVCFGNVLGAFVIMKLIESLIPVAVACGVQPLLRFLRRIHPGLRFSYSSPLCSSRKPPSDRGGTLKHN